MSKKKICLVSYDNIHNTNLTGGSVTMIRYLYEYLDSNKPEDILIDELHLYGTVYNDYIDKINSYDFVLFVSAGPTMYYSDCGYKLDNDLVDTLRSHVNLVKVPYTFIMHGEQVDEYTDSVYNIYASNENCKFIMINSEKSIDVFSNIINLPNDYFRYENSIILNSKDSILSKALCKSNIITSTSRVCTLKRQVELLSQIDKFKAINYFIKIYGVTTYWSQYSLNPYSDKDGWKYYGSFYYNDLPDILSDSKYHYGVSYYIRSGSQYCLGKRLELVSLEALNEGCLPILGPMAPDWIKDSAIVIGKREENLLPDIINSMSDEERLDRISRLYDQVVENSNLYKVFDKISHYCK